MERRFSWPVATLHLTAIVSITSFLGLRREFDHVVDAENGDGGFGGELETLHLGDGWLQNTGLLIVADGAFEEIQADPLQVGVLRFELDRDGKRQFALVDTIVEKVGESMYCTLLSHVSENTCEELW